MGDSIIIASKAEYIGDVVETSILTVSPQCVIEKAVDEAELHRLIDSLHPEYIFLESNFCETATAYVMAQQLSDNTGVFFVVFSFEPIPVQDMGRFYNLGAVGFLDYRSGKEECLNGITELFKRNYYITEETERNMEGIRGECATQADFNIRELQVLVRTAKGRSGEAIAEELAISLQYVKNIKTQIYQKAGISNNVEILLLAIDRGYVNIDQCINDMNNQQNGEEWI
jgi:DNA-binding NarL/FixJ family response regulator